MTIYINTYMYIYIFIFICAAGIPEEDRDGQKTIWRNDNENILNLMKTQIQEAQ